MPVLIILPTFLLLSHICNILQNILWWWENQSRDFDRFMRFQCAWLWKKWFCNALRVSLRMNVCFVSIWTVGRILYVFDILEFTYLRSLPSESELSTSSRDPSGEAHNKMAIFLKTACDFDQVSDAWRSCI